MVEQDAIQKELWLCRTKNSTYICFFNDFTLCWREKKRRLFPGSVGRKQSLDAHSLADPMLFNMKNSSCFNRQTYELGGGYSYYSHCSNCSSN